jgi:hypothetical protein
MRRFLRTSLKAGIAAVILVGGTWSGWIMRASVAQQEDRNRRTTANAELLKKIAADQAPKPAPPAFRSRPPGSGNFQTITVPVTRPVIETHMEKGGDGREISVQTLRFVTEEEERQVPADVRIIGSPTYQPMPMGNSGAVEAKQIADLVARYKQTDEEKQRIGLVEQITKLSTDQFEAYQKQREEELKTLEGKVHKLRELHDRREKEKKEIIGDRVRGLLRNADGLGWGDGSNSANLPYVQNGTITLNQGRATLNVPGVPPGATFDPRKGQMTLPDGRTFETTRPLDGKELFPRRDDSNPPGVPPYPAVPPVTTTPLGGPILPGTRVDAPIAPPATTSPHRSPGWRAADDDPLKRLASRLNEMAWKILLPTSPRNAISIWP